MSDNKSPEPLRVALIGCGGFSRNVQTALAATGMYRIVTCYDPDQAAMQQAADAHQAQACESQQQALEPEEVEAALFITPNHLHRLQVEEAFAAGKHVFVEKPIANSVADGIAMTRAAGKHDRLFMVGHVTRRNQSYRLLKQYMDEGRLGTVVSAEAHFSHAGGMRLAESAWRADPQKCPGLPLNVIGCHLVDVLNMLFGRPRQVAAMHRQAILKTNIDCTSTIIGYDHPVTATMVSTYVAPMVHFVRVTGTGGVVEIPRHGLEFHYYDNRGTMESRPMPAGGRLEEQFTEFAMAVRGEAEIETGGREGVMTVAVTEGSVISARENRMVDLDDLLGDF